MKNFKQLRNEALSDKDKAKRLASIKKAVEKINKSNADKAKKDALQMMKDSGMFDESVKEGAENYIVQKGKYKRKVDGKTADKMKKQGWKLIAKEEVNVQEKGKYTNIWNKVKDIKGVSNKEKDMISNMDPSRLGDVVKALAPMFEVNEARGPKLKDVFNKFKREMTNFQRKNVDLDYKAENALLAWALEYTTDIKTDDADEMDEWILNNIKDPKAFVKLMNDNK